jgi:hypothetical protein
VTDANSGISQRARDAVCKIVDLELASPRRAVTVAVAQRWDKWREQRQSEAITDLVNSEIRKAVAAIANELKGGCPTSRETSG